MCRTLREHDLFEVVRYVQLDQKRIATIVMGLKDKDEYYMGVSIMNPKEKSVNLRLGRTVARGRAYKAYNNHIKGLNIPKIKDKYARKIEEEINKVLEAYNVA